MSDNEEEEVGSSQPQVVSDHEEDDEAVNPSQSQSKKQV